MLVRVPSSPATSMHSSRCARAAEEQSADAAARVASEHCRSLEDFMRDLLVLVQAPEIRPNRMHPSSLKLLWIRCTVLPSNPASFTRTAEAAPRWGRTGPTADRVGRAAAACAVGRSGGVGVAPRWAKRGYASRTELGSLPTIREKMLGTVEASTPTRTRRTRTPPRRRRSILPEALYGREELAGEHPPDESEVSGAPGARRRSAQPLPLGSSRLRHVRATGRSDCVGAGLFGSVRRSGGSDRERAPPQVPVLRSVDWIKRIVEALASTTSAWCASNQPEPVWVRRNALMIEEYLLKRRGELKTLKIARKAAEQNVNIYESREAELNAEEVDERPDSEEDDECDDDDEDGDVLALEEQAQASLTWSLLPAPS